MNIPCVILLCLTAIAVCAELPPSSTTPRRFIERIGFLTEYYFEQDVQTFFNHKNEALRETYFVSTETIFEMMLLSLDDIAHFGIYYSNYLGMGRQNLAILFDPRDVNYALTPFFKFRHNDIIYKTGLDHRCFHEVDRQTREVPYWNQPYISVSSANYRLKYMKENYIDKGRNTNMDKLKWQVHAGYFVRKLGNMDETLISGGHPWAVTAGIDAGYYMYRSRSWLIGARNNITVLGDTTGIVYWTGKFGVDADVYNRRIMAGGFLNYNYEFSPKLPMFGKDRLFEFGFRFRI